jgi:predicted nucleotidyltransferase
METPRELAIPIPHAAIAEFCRKWGVRRLSFFGSVVRDDFDPARSDVDVLVEFRDRTPGMRFFWDVPNELAGILGARKVDLLTFDSLRPSIRTSVMAEAVPVYVEEG